MIFLLLTAIYTELVPRVADERVFKACRVRNDMVAGITASNGVIEQ